MAVADWKLPNDAPEDYGWYLVTLKNGSVEIAKYSHPKNAKAAGWFQDWMGQWDSVEILAWENMPEGYKPG